MWKNEIFEKLNVKQKAALAGGGEKRIERQHAQGKLTARERLELLFDTGTFTEIGAFVTARIDEFDAKKKWTPGDSVITGYGKIDGRMVFAASEDFTAFGGTMGEYHLKKICTVLDMAYDMRAPFITINDSGGARIEEGICALAEMGGLFLRNTRASGVIPQIAVIMGPCAGGACYSPAICDFVFMVEKTATMFITGPQVVKAAIGETVDAQTLGGASVHGQKSGVAHFLYPDDKTCLEGVKRLLSYLPSNNASSPPVFASFVPVDLCRGLQEVVVENRHKCYDMHAVIGAIVDKSSFLEIHKDFAPNIIVGFGRIDGKTVGFAANQPIYMGGSLDYHASDKLARFIRFCDCFNIPLVTLVDVPAFLPGKEQEQAGIIRHGAKVLYAYSEATVPKITLILRKAYGGAYIAMNSKLMGADMVFAWPIAEIAVMGAEGAVDIIFHKEIEAAQDPTERREKLIREYEERFITPYIAAERGYVDAVIRPEDTRTTIRDALEALQTKHGNLPDKKHGNMPL